MHRVGEKFKLFSVRSGFTGHTFTGEVSGDRVYFFVDSERIFIYRMKIRARDFQGQTHTVKGLTRRKLDRVGRETGDQVGGVQRHSLSF